jgi:hypothetical protein
VGVFPALLALERNSLDQKTVQETLGCIFKYREDISYFQSLWQDEDFRESLLSDVREGLC